MKKTKDSKLVKDLCDGLSIRDIVEARTGMSADELLNDNKVYKINNLDEAVDLFTDYAKRKAHIHLHGDYDGDGAGCGFIIGTLCKAIKADYDVYLPDRESDGYGMKPSHVEQHLHPGDLLILADNGIACHEAIEKAKEMGCGVIVLDHHLGVIGSDGEIDIPKADVVVDPHVTGGDFDDYCGAGLCYKFAENFFERKCTAIRDRWEPILKKMNVMAAISTITDSVSLTGENRRIVRNGFDCYEKGYLTTGLKAVSKELWMPKARHLVADDIGFTLGPAINAMGRLIPHGAQYLLDTITYDGEEVPQLAVRAKKIANVNKDRQELSNKYKEADFKEIEEKGLDKNGVIVLFREGTVAGLDGIRCGKITEEYGCLSFCFSRDLQPDILKGSGRSVDGIDMKSLLDKLDSLLLTYGGHEAACGLKLREDVLETFNREANRLISKDDIHIDNNVHYDKEVEWEDVPELIQEYNKYGPYGNGNEPLKFYVKNIPIQPGYVPKPVDGVEQDPTFYMGSKKDTFCAMTPDGTKILGFHIAQEFRDEGEPKSISAVVTIGEDEKRGCIIPQMRIEQFTMDIERRIEEPALDVKQI